MSRRRTRATGTCEELKVKESRGVCNVRACVEPRPNDDGVVEQVQVFSQRRQSMSMKQRLQLRTVGLFDSTVYARPYLSRHFTGTI